jgi:signal transduction histidine kinase
MILVIPLIATLALAGARLVEGGQRAFEADLVRSLAAVSVEASTVAHQLHHERIEAARMLAADSGAEGEGEAGAESGTDAASFNGQSARTDDAVEAYQAARSELSGVPAVINGRLQAIDDHLAELDVLRQQVLGDPPITVSGAVLRYGAILTDVIGYQESVVGAVEDSALSEEIRATVALSKAKAHAADAEAIAQVIAAGQQLDEEQLGAFLATQAGQEEAFLAFRQTASPEQQAAADRAITGGNVEFADTGALELLQSAGEPDGGSTIPATSFAGMVDTARFVEEQLQGELLQSATRTRDEVFQQVLVESVAVVVALVVAIAIAALLARSLARSLGRLRQTALAVAERELPAAVERLSDPRTLGEHSPAQLVAQIQEPIQLHARDEVGEVARAFNVVHRAAVRVAAEQAALRTSVSAMFLNLARRSQSLVDRMVKQLDQLERHEADPKRLAGMFTLDHLAIRMRRNDENLLTLAGADSSPPRTKDASIPDVLRAAQAEVEHYDRIEFGTVDSDVSVVAGAVNDVVRLVAELFDNATRFSPPDASVVCEARRLGNYLIIQIEDRGVGMAPEHLNQLNTWLAAPPELEVTTFRKMGLAVVARLASRHQIRVELRADPSSGTTAYAALPQPVLLLPVSRLRTFERPAPRAPMPVASERSSEASDAVGFIASERSSEASDAVGFVELAPPPRLEPVPAAPPPVPARYLGQLPRRSAEVVHHAANRRAPRTGPVATDVTTELPIFQDARTAWFRDHNGQDISWPPDQLPRAGSAPPPAPQSPPPAPQSPPPAPQPPPPAPQPPPPAPQPPPVVDHQAWRTAADEGWQAAAAAAEPTPGGATVSGLPIRQPQAQLVPGSAQPGGSSSSTGGRRRSPEDVRGLLSAYHRGVQRGREHGAR